MDQTDIEIRLGKVSEVIGILCSTEQSFQLDILILGFLVLLVKPNISSSYKQIK